MSEPPATVHLIDALPYVFRAWYSLPASMQAPDGSPINAVHGFAGMLARYLAEERPRRLAICFDESLESSFRNDLYPDYKSSRESAPEELIRQLELCKELAGAVGAAVLADARYEADDLIGTLAELALAAGDPVTIVTNDKDLGQLVTDSATLYDFAKGERLDLEGVRRKMGVYPRQVPDLLGLAGDSVDDIPGVRGVGPKSAVALLEAFDSLDGIYADLDAVERLDVRGARSLRAKLEAGRDLAFLSRELATIARDAPVGDGLESLGRQGVDREALEALLARIGSERLAARFDGL
jgi:DNA polymerase-1